MTTENVENINQEKHEENTEQKMDYKELYEKTTTELAKTRLLNLADLENARKAHNKDLQEHIKYANEKLLTALIPLIDTFDLALQYAKDSNATKPITMLRTQFMQLLSKYHVTEITSNIGDQFDASLHEAVDTVANEEMQDNQLATIEQQGYKLHQRVIRPARVVVVKNKE